MSKRKTVLEFAIAAVLLGGSSTVAVLYFPYVALAIKFGMVVPTVPVAIFAISVMVALASLITLAVFTVSAIHSKDAKGKPNEFSGEPRSKNKEEGQSLVQEEEKIVLTSTPPLLPQETEELVIPVSQQQPVGDLVIEVEVPQTEKRGSLQFQSLNKSVYNVLRNNLEEPMFVSLKFPNFLNATSDSSLSDSYSSMASEISLEGLPPVPIYTSSPLNSFNQSQPFPVPPMTCFNNVYDVLDYRQSHLDESDLSSSIPYSMIVEGSVLQQSRMDQVIRSNLPGYDVGAKIYDSVNPVVVESQREQPSLPSLTIAARLKVALDELEGQRPNRTNSEEREWFNINTGQAVLLNSVDRNWMDNHFDSFDDYSCDGSTAQHSMVDGGQVGENSESGHSTMLSNVNEQQYINMQPPGSPSRNNGF